MVVLNKAENKNQWGTLKKKSVPCPKPIKLEYLWDYPSIHNILKVCRVSSGQPEVRTIILEQRIDNSLNLIHLVVWKKFLLYFL